MTLSIFDWTLFLGFFAVVIGFSLWKSRGSGGDGEDYFLAGRGLPMLADPKFGGVFQYIQ